MNIKKLSKIEEISLFDEIATKTDNVLHLEIIKSVELINSFTDIDLSEYIEDGYINYSYAYSALEENGIISDFISEIGVARMANFDKMIMSRYEEINSLQNTLKELMKSMDSTVSKFMEGVNSLTPEQIALAERLDRK